MCNAAFLPLGGAIQLLEVSGYREPSFFFIYIYIARCLVTETSLSEDIVIFFIIALLQLIYCDMFKFAGSEKALGVRMTQVFKEIWSRDD